MGEYKRTILDYRPILVHCSGQENSHHFLAHTTYLIVFTNLNQVGTVSA